MVKDFLQSEEWRKFQEAAGRRTFLISDVSIIKHTLSVVGSYLYVPRGDVSEMIVNLIELAKKEKAGWIRIDTDYNIGNYKIVKAPHDIQPREIFVIDITKSEDELLNEMKPKTRYNIRLAEKKGVKVFISREQKYIDKFCELVKITAKRDGIIPHPESYYRKMFEIIPSDILKLYVAEYEGKIITANLAVFYGNIAIYLHGASDNENRNVMASYLLQWRQIQDAKKAGYAKYDFGGVKTNSSSSWAGITKFKIGFSPGTEPTKFPGSYDIVINPFKYNLYRFLQKIKSIF